MCIRDSGSAGIPPVLAARDSRAAAGRRSVVDAPVPARAACSAGAGSPGRPTVLAARRSRAAAGRPGA
eukprot:13569074-Alexandrium_andersonii.AAC.1